MSEHKGFDPSAKKLSKLRKQGQVFKSNLASQALALLIIFISIINMLQYSWSNSTQMLEYCFSVKTQQMASCSVSFLLELLKETIFLTLVPILFASVSAICIEVFQVGFFLNLGQLMPKSENIDLLKGFHKQIQGIKKTPLVFLKLLIVILVLFCAGKHAIEMASLELIDFSGRRSLGLIRQLDSWIYTAGILLMACAICEYFFNKRQFINRHSMSLEELKIEIKEEEGDPHIKSHRRSLHEALAMQEIVKRVRASKVIIIDQ